MVHYFAERRWWARLTVNFAVCLTEECSRRLDTTILGDIQLNHLNNRINPLLAKLLHSFDTSVD